LDLNAAAPKTIAVNAIGSPRFSMIVSTPTTRMPPIQPNTVQRTP
jgi:hypothetical protein